MILTVIEHGLEGHLPFDSHGVCMAVALLMTVGGRHEGGKHDVQYIACRISHKDSAITSTVVSSACGNTVLIYAVSQSSASSAIFRHMMSAIIK